MDSALISRCRCCLLLLLLYGVAHRSLAQDKGAPLAAPGLPVPNTATPWALDTRAGQKELVPIHHATIQVNRHTGKNIAGSLTGSIFYHPVMTTELEGEHARIQLETHIPILYFHNEDDPAPDDRGAGEKEVFQLVPAKIANGHRIVSTINFNQLTTHAKRKDDVIATTLEELSNGWFRMTPKSPLPEGEYVLLSQPAKGEQYAVIVYPFGIAARTAEAQDAVKPVPMPRAD